MEGIMALSHRVNKNEMTLSFYFHTKTQTCRVDWIGLDWASSVFENPHAKLYSLLHRT